MRFIAKVTAALAAGALLLAGCSSNTASADGEATTDASPASAFPVTITHSAGETTIESDPQKIVVLDMAVLDTIHALGADDKVIGAPVKSIPTWLESSFPDLENTGTLKEPDVEAIAKLDPDLIIVGGRSSGFYEELSATFTVIDASVSWESKTYIEDISANVRMLGKALGKAEAGEEAAKKIEDTVKEYTGKAKDLGTALVLMTNGNEISMHGVESRWAPIWSVFGFKEVEETAADEGHQGDKLSFETVADLNPDWMFVVDRDAAVGNTEAGTTAEQVLDNDLINSTTAAKEDHIAYLDPERWYIVMTGANNFIEMLNEVNNAIEKA